jgi:hypothetical protein
MAGATMRRRRTKYSDTPNRTTAPRRQTRTAAEGTTTEGRQGWFEYQAARAGHPARGEDHEAHDDEDSLKP